MDSADANVPLVAFFATTLAVAAVRLDVEAEALLHLAPHSFPKDQVMFATRTYALSNENYFHRPFLQIVCLGLIVLGLRLAYRRRLLVDNISAVLLIFAVAPLVFLVLPGTNMLSQGKGNATTLRSMALGHIVSFLASLAGLVVNLIDWTAEAGNESRKKRT